MSFFIVLHLGLTGLKESRVVELKFDVFNVTDGLNRASNIWLVPSVLCFLSRSIIRVSHHLLQVLNWVKKLSSTHPLSISGRLEMTQIGNHEVKPHRIASV